MGKINDKNQQSLQIVKNNNSKDSYICEYCGKEFTEDYRVDINSIRKSLPRFCSRKCATSYSYSHIPSNKYKTATCSVCGGTYQVKNHATTKNVICKSCKERNHSKSLQQDVLKLININFQPTASIINIQEKFIEGNLSRYQYYNQLSKLPADTIPLEKRMVDFFSSSSFLHRTGVLSKLGFNYEKDLIEEYYRIRNILTQEYSVLKNSVKHIEDSFRMGRGSLSPVYLYYFGIQKRTASESAKLTFSRSDNIKKAFLNRPLPEKGSNINRVGKVNNFKEGYHIAWDGSKIYLRSSYEFDFVKVLDKFKVDFISEYSFYYYDNSLQKVRKGYPDFYFPKSNILLEVKSCRFYNPTNLKDRAVEANRKGIDFYVYLDKKFFIKNDFPDYSFLEKKQSDIIKKELESKLGVII